MIAPIVLTPELQSQIVASIRAGGYPHIAAQAWGVPRWLLQRWLRKGRRAGGCEPYRTFARLVDQASGQARLKAEIATLDKDPRFWLKHGLGRDRPEAPGWSAMVRATPRAANPGASALLNRKLMGFLATLRAAFASHPEVLDILTRVADGIFV